MGPRNTAKSQTLNLKRFCAGEGSGRLAQDANTAGAEGDKSALDTSEKRQALSSAQAALANRQTSTSEYDKDAGGGKAVSDDPAVRGTPFLGLMTVCPSLALLATDL